MFFLKNEVPTLKQTIDVVAIHGLNGDYETTWTHDGSGKNWLRDFLSDDIPEVRVMSWGYNAQVLKSKSIGSIESFARGLLIDLKACRSTTESKERPLVFVCHSLGGLVFKKVSHGISYILVECS